MASPMTLSDMRSMSSEPLDDIFEKLTRSSYGFEEFLELESHNPYEMDIALQLIACVCSEQNVGRVKKLLNIILIYEQKFLIDDFLQVIGSVHLGDHNINLPRLIENYCVVLNQIMKIFDHFYTSEKTLPNLLNLVEHLEKSGNAASAKSKVLDTQRAYDVNQRAKNMPPSQSEDFRSLSIFPQAKDINSSIEELKFPLRPNIIKGSYRNVEDYLDLHFKLLRADMVMTFRDTIAQFREKTYKSLQMYQNCSVSYPPEYSVKGVRYSVSFKCDDPIDWEKTRFLLPGSLVCLSDDAFKSFLVFGTILERLPVHGFHKDVKLSITVEEGSCDDTDVSPKQRYCLIETPAYFESYRHVFKIFQKHLGRNNFPFEDFIVKLFFDDNIPSSVKRKKVCLHEKCISDGTDVDECKRFNILNFEDWPSSEELKLDSYQYSTFQAALTQKFTLIQGPPGTGKTFLGSKIVKAFLDNRTDTEPISKPIMICSVTNHALDQFLEHLLKHTKKIVRLGGQSDSKDLECHIISNLIAAARCVRERTKNSGIFKESLSIVKLISPDIVKSAPSGTQSEPFLQLLGLCRDINSGIKSADKCLNNFLSCEGLREIIPKGIQDSLCRNLADSLDVNVLKWLQLQDVKNSIEVCKQKWNTVANLNVDRKDLVQSVSSKSVWLISVTDRYILLHIWREMRLEELKFQIVKAKKEYFSVLKMQSEGNLHFDTCTLISRADIIGVTMTGAAKNYDKLCFAAPEIMIVEEAAEALEAHLIASIPPSVKQLILIGDHEQLRPIPSTYILAKDYNLSISLFERLFKNKAPSCTLVTQHRMRPCFADLLVPTIYKLLESHSSVYEYENIRGIRHNLFFLQHNESEEEACRSFCNRFEAKCIVNLALYFLKQGYASTQITVLAMYAAQVRLIKEVAKDSNVEAYITTVDNYQGEENDIVLISFVRSNENEFIGFLKETNRVCVALSRARKGLYCIGNFKVLSRRSDFFEKVVEKVAIQDSFGQSLPLQCPSHGRSLIVQDDDDFSRLLHSGCSLKCQTELPCGHNCSRPCHFDDSEHSLYKCQEKCAKLIEGPDEKHPKIQCHKLCYQPCKSKIKKIKLPCGHKCSSTANLQLSSHNMLCQVEVEKLMPSCGHSCKVPCSSLETATCTASVSVVLDCGHRKLVPCNLSNRFNPICKELLSTVAGCGHTVEVPCDLSTDFEVLHTFCIRSCDCILNCGHACVGRCRECFKFKIHARCTERCELNLICGHSCQSTCAVPCNQCHEKCHLRCSHARCSNPCIKPCIECTQPCERQCSHQRCTLKCYEICEIGPCQKRCENILSCGHQCIGLCNDPCPLLCKVCHHDQFESDLSADDLYVLLEDCDHFIEHKKLTLHIEELVSSFEWPYCPDCKKVITKSMRYSDHLKRARQFVLRSQDFRVDCTDIEFIFRTLFGISNIAPWRFQHIQEKILDLIENQLPTDALNNRLKVFLVCLQDLVRYEKKLDSFPHMEEKLEQLISWILKNIDSASYQQLHEFEQIICSLETVFGTFD